MDRWGPSQDCESCGKACSRIEFDEDGNCPDCSESLEDEAINDRDDYLEDMRLFNGNL